MCIDLKENGERTGSAGGRQIVFLTICFEMKSDFVKWAKSPLISPQKFHFLNQILKHSIIVAEKEQ